MPQAAFLICISQAKEDFHTLLSLAATVQMQTLQKGEKKKKVNCETIEKLQGNAGFRSLKAGTVREPKCFTDFCSPDKYLSLESRETYS